MASRGPRRNAASKTRCPAAARIRSMSVNTSAGAFLGGKRMTESGRTGKSEVSNTAIHG
ncbi:hypothetical protein PTKU64_84630 [Paraburkholderia terrae]|uniref:Uncharacterized protein n=1 Tax=Paraburkholderia terrae TaxID=311230 RepID=A0ABN6JVC4_9BURK|nr:hypothetical protein PTKU64_84630 [Paraburkholderia terrae]